jgi:hypothetical protein
VRNRYTVIAFSFIGINFRGLVKKSVDSVFVHKIRGLYIFNMIKFHWIANLREIFNTIDRCQTASQDSLFVGFLIFWISLLTKIMKIGTPKIKVISQYYI